MTLTQKLIQNLSKNKNVQSFLSDFEKLSSDLKKRSKQLNQMWTTEKSKTVAQAQTQYHKMVKNISQAQLELDREVSKAISLIIKSADDVEKNLTAYKKKAMAQKAKVEKVMSSNKVKTAGKKAKMSKTTAKVARKGSRKK